MCRRTGFHADQTPRQARKEPNDLAASQALNYDRCACLINAVDLENVLGQVQPNCCNLAHGWLPLLVIFDDHHFGTQMPSGGHPPHQLAASFVSVSYTHLTL